MFLIELVSSRMTSLAQPATSPLADVRFDVMLKMDAAPTLQSELLVSQDQASQPMPTRCASESSHWYGMVVAHPSPTPPLANSPLIRTMSDARRAQDPSEAAGVFTLFFSVRQPWVFSLHLLFI